MQCQDGDVGAVAPLAPRTETLEHLENLSVNVWQPGWEKVCDRSDTQMCGLLPVPAALRGGGITH